VSELVSAGLYQAVPLDVLSSPAKLGYILDRLVEHETEWSDHQKGRRDIANAALAEHYSGNPTFIFEVWRLDDMSLCVLIAFTRINPGVGAELHPVFFDGKLRNGAGKRDLLLRAMDWAFRTYGLHRLSMETPETSVALADFARRKLGFRFEAERRTIQQRRAVPHGHITVRRWTAVTPSAVEAEWGSRKYQAFFKHGSWKDVLLLSVTNDEFASFVREATWVSSSISPLPSKPSPAILPDSAKDSSVSSATVATPASSAS
jgi:RimJ/RimL family protein N-acetyltransferase